MDEVVAEAEVEVRVDIEVRGDVLHHTGLTGILSLGMRHARSYTTSTRLADYSLTGEHIKKVVCTTAMGIL